VTVRFSRALAIVVGIITLLAEVARRRQQLLDPAAVLLWTDDLLLGGFLLYGAWRLGADEHSGRPVLAAAWGFMTGMSYYSLFEQLQRLAGPDPSGAAPPWVIALKIVLLVLGVAGMVAALRGLERPRSGPAVPVSGRQ
jgi:hypothetical protein